ncbi:hypothetical protein FQR65_LT05712 [Abscondita terminalis]|nr:hypothetical protein FQR65_LT05712 [Abscondita terminalis]
MVIWFILLLSLLAIPPVWNVPQPIRDRWIRDTSPYNSECICATGAETTAAVNVLKELKFPNDPCLKCFIKCIQIKMGLMRSDGTIVPGAWVNVVAGVTTEIAIKCTNESSSVLDACQKAYDWSICLRNALS